MFPKLKIRLLKSPLIISRKNLFSSWNRQHQQPFRNYNVQVKNQSFLRNIFFGLLFTGTVYYLFWPRHTFSPEVASLLRSGLYAEMGKTFEKEVEKKDNHDQDKDHDHNHNKNKWQKPDYRKALDFYKEALHVAQKQNLSVLSDEYTGICIKIADMHERLGEIDLASDIYQRLADAYVTAIRFDFNNNNNNNNNNTFENNKSIISKSASDSLLESDIKAHLIQRDLQVVIRFCQLQGEIIPHECKKMLLNHLSIVQKDMQLRKYLHRKSTESKLAALLEEKKKAAEDSNGNNNDLSMFSQKPLWKDILNLRGNVGTLVDFPIQIINPNTRTTTTVPLKIYSNGTPAPKWLPYRDELISAAELFTTFCINTDDLDLAERTKNNTNQLMIISGISLREILLSQCNLASIYYIHADRLLPVNRSMDQSESENQLESQSLNKRKGLVLIERSKKIYKNIIKYSSTLPASVRSQRLAVNDDNPNDTRRSNTIVSESSIGKAGIDGPVSLALYGLGIILFHEGKLNDAKEKLLDAHLRAKGSGFTDLVTVTDNELQKLQQVIAYKKTKSIIDVENKSTNNKNIINNDNNDNANENENENNDDNNNDYNDDNTGNNSN